MENDSPPQLRGDDDEVAWGMQEIAATIKRTPSQGYYLFQKGAFGDSVKKVGHRTLVGSRRKIRQTFGIET